MRAILSLLLLLPSIAYSATQFQPTQTFPITGGVNMGIVPQRIDDTESPDMSNFVCDDQSCYVRNGTRRFNTTAISTNPIRSLYKGYSNSGKSIFLCTTMNRIFVSTVTDLVNLDVFYTSGNHTALWKSTYTGLSLWNQRFKFATYNNNILMVDGSTHPLRYDIDAGSVTILEGSPPKAKFILTQGEYVLMARTTDQPNTIFYSDVANSKSWPVNNSIVIDSSKGEKITGLTNAIDGVKIYFDNSVWKLRFNVLTPDIDGDQVVTPLFNGFGCIAPYSLVSFGDGDFFLARDGFRIALGGSSFIVSDKVRPIVKRIIESGTYDSVVSFFDKKNKWIWISYEDDLRYPKGHNNRVLIYDLRLNQWYILDGIYADSFVQWDGQTDNNEIFYGESFDGYVYQADVEGLLTDARRELPLLQMEATQVGSQPAGESDGCQVVVNVSSRDTTIFIEGESSFSRNDSEKTCLNVRRNTAEYPDKTLVLDRDLMQFYVLNQGSIADDDIRWSFDWYNPSNSSNEIRYFDQSIPTQNEIWYRIEQPLSNRESFLSGSEEPKISIKNQLRRIVLRSSISSIKIKIDDFRIVQSSDNPVIAYRYTKPFDMGRIESKVWGYLYVNMDKNANTEVKIDLINDFRDSVINRVIDKDFNDVLYVSSGGFIQQIKKSDYKLIRSSNASDKNITNLYATKDFLWGLSQQNETIYKMDLTTNTLLDQTSTFSGVTTMSSPTSITATDNFVFVADTGRIIKTNTDLVFISSISDNGIQSITADNDFVYGFNSINKEIVKYDNELNLVFSIGGNAFSSATIFAFGDYLIVSLIRNDDFSAGSSSVPVIQLVDKETFKVVKESRQKNSPENTLPTFITSDGSYIFYATTGAYRVQKYTFENLDLVDELILNKSIDGLASNSYFSEHKIKKVPIGVNGRFLQLRYRVDQPRDRIKLYDQTFTAILQDLQ